MKNLFKGKVGTVLILLATVALAGVAVFTAVRLYDLRNQAVAPNVPSSIPQASELAQQGEACGGNVANAKSCASGLTCFKPQGAPADVGGTCQPIGTTAGEGSPCAGNARGAICASGLVCVVPQGAPADVGGTCQKANACSLTFSLTAVASMSCVSLTKDISSPKLNDQVVFSCNASGTAAGALAFFRWNVDSGNWVEDASGTAVDISSHIATRAAASIYKNGSWTWQCRICTDSTKSNCTTWGSPNSCTNTFSIVPSPTPTATPVPQCNDVCTSVAQCGANQVCNIATGETSGNCRNNSCTSESSCVCATATPTATPTLTPTPTGTPNSCNGTCGSNFNCGDGLMCYQGFCRNPSCASNSSCSCGGSTPTPTPNQPVLPNTGVDWPTTAGFGIGILVILGSMLLAL